MDPNSWKTLPVLSHPYPYEPAAPSAPCHDEFQRLASKKRTILSLSTSSLKGNSRPTTWKLKPICIPVFYPSIGVARIRLCAALTRAAPLMCTVSLITIAFFFGTALSRAALLTCGIYWNSPHILLCCPYPALSARVLQCGARVYNFERIHCGMRGAEHTMQA